MIRALLTPVFINYLAIYVADPFYSVFWLINLFRLHLFNVLNLTLFLTEKSSTDGCFIRLGFSDASFTRTC